MGLITSNSKRQGIAPIIGPKNGIILVTPMINAISTGYSIPIIEHPIKHKTPIIMESTILPIIKPENLSEAIRTFLMTTLPFLTLKIE